MTESVLKVRSFKSVSCKRKIRKNVGSKRVYNFLGKDEKTQRNLYVLSLKTSLWKSSRTFNRTLYPNNNHVTCDFQQCRTSVDSDDLRVQRRYGVFSV